MKMSCVSRIKKDIRSVRFKDLSGFEGTSINAVIDKSGKKKTFAFTDTESETIDKKVLSVTSVGDKVFYYAEDSKLYYVYYGALMTPELRAFSYAPTIVEVLQNGEHVPFVIDGRGNGYAIDEEGSVTTYKIPKGRVATVYNGMLFVANGNEVYFSAPMDFSDFIMDLNHGGVIKTDKNDGDVCSLVVQDDKLLILTTHAVYIFTAFGDRLDYTLKKVETIIPTIRKFSAKDCGDKIVFVSNERLYSYSREKISAIESVLDGGEYKASGNSAVDKGVYYLPVTDTRGKNMILRYDVQSGLECLLDTDTALIADGGYSVSESGNLLSLQENTSTEKGVSFKSKRFNFGSAKKKVVHEISLFCSSSGTLIIDGDCGRKRFSLKKGGNEKRMNVTSKTFGFTFLGTQDFNVENVTIKYRIKGE